MDSFDDYYDNDQHQYECDIDLLVDLLLENPDGITILDWLALHPSLTRYRFNQAVRNTRELFGANKDINIVSRPAGYRQPWRYELVGSVPQADPWVHNRIGDAESRMSTILSVCTSISAGTHGNSKDGKKARRITKGLTRLLEDLAEIEEEFA